MNITRHNLALLASLSALLEEKNVTKAAARLGLSQPALSSQLATLREIFGDPLLTTSISGKGMVLTPRGAHLRVPLRQALQALEDVVSNEPVFDPHSAQRIFSLGANDNASAIMAPRLVQFVRDNEMSGIRFSFRVIDPNKLAEQLENGELDVALVSKDRLSQAPQKLLFEEEFRMAQRKDHPRGTQPPTLEEYARLEHVIVSGSGGGYRGVIDDILKEKNISRHVGVSVQYYSLVPLILQTTDLVCTLPARFLERYSDLLVSTPLPFDAKYFSLYATWHERFDKDPGHIWLRAQLALCAFD
ncbi:LysR family transcriptional regulator [Collimonas sp.]|jgi:DNA-binding transcriptional LysR family regulator|uniref:LysR family transcriptional regulator n=1 Tax=Collimonas sp. TaxID=1963772 RepID=UPI002CE59166|nr:LysR family transcriptional regulator [Collimonas sp.]HWX02267.1 LysR family transcriptional regulator [Collimonas sp.]